MYIPHVEDDTTPVCLCCASCQLSDSVRTSTCEQRRTCIAYIWYRNCRHSSSIYCLNVDSAPPHSHTNYFSHFPFTCANASHSFPAVFCLCLSHSLCFSVLYARFFFELCIYSFFGRNSEGGNDGRMRNIIERAKEPATAVAATAHMLRFCSVSDGRLSHSESERRYRALPLMYYSIPFEVPSLRSLMQRTANVIYQTIVNWIKKFLVRPVHNKNYIIIYGFHLPILCFVFSRARVCVWYPLYLPLFLVPHVVFSFFPFSAHFSPSRNVDLHCCCLCISFHFPSRWRVDGRSANECVSFCAHRCIRHTYKERTELSRVHWRRIWCALYALAQCTSSWNSFFVLVYCSCHAPIMRRKPIYGNQMYVHCMETRRRRRERTEFPFLSIFFLSSFKTDSHIVLACCGAWGANCVWTGLDARYRIAYRNCRDAACVAHALPQLPFPFDYYY